MKKNERLEVVFALAILVVSIGAFVVYNNKKKKALAMKPETKPTAPAKTSGADADEVGSESYLANFGTVGQ